MAQAARVRTLGDKLFFLRQLCEEDVRDIEVLTDYRIKVRCEEEYDRIRAASKPRRDALPFPPR